MFRKISIKAIAATLLCLAVMHSFAQESYKVCGTAKKAEAALLLDPTYFQNHEALESFTRQYIAAQKKNAVDRTSNLPVIYKIPVVFHIMHDYGVENISKAQVLDAIRIINESYQKRNSDTNDVVADFQSVFADCQVEFRLAQIDPNGNCTDGITRHQTEQTYAADDPIKAIVNWPRDKYLNIWVAHTLESGLAGYAYYPGASTAVDGVLTLHDYTGGIGSAQGTNYSDRHLVHEIGHSLNLYHTWGPTNDPGLASNCNIDDLVADTPNEIGVANFSCNTNQHTCGEVLPDMVQNYMNYASCRKLFTEGQKTRMHAALNSSVSSRDNLWQTANLIATGTNDGYVPVACIPVADFTNKVYYVCSGQSIAFKDFSWQGDPTSWNWSFPGGTPSSSTDQNPVIQYNTPGIYDVALTVSNSAGSNTLTRTGLVIVSSATANHLFPYSEDFESIVSFPGTTNEWFIQNTNGTSAWDITTSAAFSGVQSLKLNNFTGNPNGDRDVFVTPSFDLTNVSASTATFRLAFATKNSTSADSLRVYASRDCGATWTIRYTKVGAALATAGVVTSDFIPTAPQWRTETVSLASSLFNNQPNVRLKFVYTQNSGNNIYIDDININGTVGLDELEAENMNLSVYPNPSKGNTTLMFDLKKAEHLSIKLFDMHGREVQSIAYRKFEAGNHSIEIKANADGVYVLKMCKENTVISRKVLFQDIK